MNNAKVVLKMMRMKFLTVHLERGVQPNAHFAMSRSHRSSRKRLRQSCACVFFCDEAFNPHAGEAAYDMRCALRMGILIVVAVDSSCYDAVQRCATLVHVYVLHAAPLTVVLSFCHLFVIRAESSRPRTAAPCPATWLC